MSDVPPHTEATSKKLPGHESIDPGHSLLKAGSAVQTQPQAAVQNTGFMAETALALAC